MENMAKIMGVLDELAKYRLQIIRLRVALQALRDEQTGPPLDRRRQEWAKAMDESKQVLHDTEGK